MFYLKTWNKVWGLDLPKLFDAEELEIVVDKATILQSIQMYYDIGIGFDKDKWYKNLKFSQYIKYKIYLKICWNLLGFIEM